MPNLSQFKQFVAEQPYTRHLVLKTPNMEILVVCWLPNQHTPFHGHGPTDGVVTVVEGTITNTTIPAASANGSQPACHITTTHRAGDICHTPVGAQHRMANTSDEPAVTLHFYAPPLGPAYTNPDLGYANSDDITEHQLPDELIRVVMANPGVHAAMRAAEKVGYCI